MNLNEYTDRVNSSLPKLIDEETFVRVLRLDNNLGRFNMFNRITFSILYNYDIIDLKTKEEWYSVGRKIINNEAKVYTAIPKYSIHYKDTDTHREIDINKFTPDEINKALELNIIYKDEEIENLNLETLYDIKNTCSIDKCDKYNISKPVIDLKEYYDILNILTGIEITESDGITFFSAKDNLLFISKGSYENMVDNLTEAFISIILRDTEQEKYIPNSLELYKNIKDSNLEDLLKESIKFSVKTLFGIIDKNNIILSLRQSGVTSYAELIDILMITDETVTNIVKHIKYTNSDNYKDAIANISMIRKSDLLLNIMRANSIHNKIEGAN